MTANNEDVAGGIFLVGKTIDPGDLDVSFKISAGAGECPQPDQECLNDDGEPYEVADGFALSFWNLRPTDIDALWSLVGFGGNGAGFSQVRLEESGFTRRPEGFTIEFDLYPNSCPNNGFWDPVQGPHVEIMRDGRFYRGADDLTVAQRCLLTEFPDEEGQTWAACPQIADNFWHLVNVRIRGRQVVVRIDENIILDTELPDFNFKGGILAFSGGSGSISAYQRFDELVLESNCEP